jgi:hypothetical protein
MDDVQSQTSVIHGDEFVTDIIPNLSRTYGRTYVLYVGVATVGIGDKVTWDVDIEVYSRIDRGNIRLVY